MKSKIRILIVDDHQLLREGLKALLMTDDSLEVVGEASSGEQAVELADKVQPDVVFMDMVMPGIDGVEAVRRIKGKYPNVSAIMLTAYPGEEHIASAVEAGAAGYLLKDASPELLCHAAHTVYEGGTLLGADLLRKTLAALKSAAVKLGERTMPYTTGANNLTPRETEVLGLIVDGKANKEIAAALIIAEDTVKKHVQSIIAKLGVSDRTQAAVKAVREGLLG